MAEWFETTFSSSGDGFIRFILPDEEGLVYVGLVTHLVMGFSSLK